MSDLDAIEKRTVPATPAIPQLREDVFALVAEVRALRERVATLEGGIRDLSDQLKRGGLRRTAMRLDVLLDASHDQEDPRSLATNDPLALAHQKHYQQCDCLGDAAECCQPNCPCHDQGGE